MASTPKPTVLIIHGAWHVAKHYTALTSPLEAVGYTVNCQTLPSCNDASPPNTTLDDDVRFCRKEALKIMESGQDLIAIMHSYGGVVGTNALANIHPQHNAKSAKVRALIYMAAFIPFENQSLAEMFGGQLPPWLTCNPDTKVIDIDDPAYHFYNDLSREEANDCVKLLVRHPTVTQYEPVRDPELKKELGDRVAWREVENIVYIKCMKDTGIPDFVQQMMVDRIESEGGLGTGKVKVEVLQAGHSPFHNMPDQVVGVVQRCT